MWWLNYTSESMTTAGYIQLRYTRRPKNREVIVYWCFTNGSESTSQKIRLSIGGHEQLRYVNWMTWEVLLFSASEMLSVMFRHCRAFFSLITKWYFFGEISIQWQSQTVHTIDWCHCDLFYKWSVCLFDIVFGVRGMYLLQRIFT